MVPTLALNHYRVAIIIDLPECCVPCYFNMVNGQHLYRPSAFPSVEHLSALQFRFPHSPLQSHTHTGVTGLREQFGDQRLAQGHFDMVRSWGFNLQPKSC